MQPLVIRSLGSNYKRRQGRFPPNRHRSISEYDEESESDDGKKGLLIDISWKGWKMAVTSLNRGRRERKTNNDDNIDDDNTKKSSPGLAITLR